MVESSSDMSLQRKQHSWLSPIAQEKHKYHTETPHTLTTAERQRGGGGGSAAATACKFDFSKFVK
jgi:hypothetical protein